MEFKTSGLELSPIKALHARACEEGAVSLAQGVPKFVLPKEIGEAAFRAISQGKTDFYGPPAGILELRKAISSRHLKEEGTFYDPNSEVIVTAGALQAMTAALAALLRPGDELLVPTPSYFPLRNLPKVLGIQPIEVPLTNGDWRLSLADVKKAITAKTAGILLVHPNNPTGTVYSRDELEALLRLAEKHDLLVFTDEVYKYFTYGLSPYTSLGRFKQYSYRFGVSAGSIRCTKRFERISRSAPEIFGRSPEEEEFRSEALWGARFCF
jgi:aspartate/methionine/tyrosine aminotransferase